MIVFTGLFSHDCIRVDCTEQYCPPFSGLKNNIRSKTEKQISIYFGLSHKRCDFFTALPQVRVHGDHGDHSPQFPLIGSTSCVLRHWPRKQRCKKKQKYTMNSFIVLEDL